MKPLLSQILELRINRSHTAIYNDLMRDLNERERKGAVQVRRLDPLVDDSGDLKLFATNQTLLNDCVESLLHQYPETLLAREPQAVSLQTISQEVVSYGRCSPNTGGFPLFAGVRIKLTPLPRGKGIEYTNA